MTIQDLRDRNLIVFETVSGSKAYGTNLPHSDTDIRGVFILPQTDLYGLTYTEQVNDRTNDIIFYELGRFVDLLSKNNPNILGLLCAPADCIIHRDPIMDHIRVADFLSKLCRDTFAGYAISQIKKARGLNKKIVNPVEKERKSLLNFCHVLVGDGTVPVLTWLERQGLTQEQCGLVNLTHARDVFALHIDKTDLLGFRGIVLSDESNQVALSSIPERHPVEAHLYVNHDGYSYYCKSYREYWEWVSTRNDARYQNTLDHGKNYDAKNMMHTIRLLDMAAEILERGEVIVRRPNRDYLLQVRVGGFDYADLLEQAEARVAQIDTLAANSPLPDAPDLAQIEKTLIIMRQTWYGK
ncbi:DNA polymerase beta superfamily protein [Fibrella aquatilis]|uniref:Nucleotidyltransferase domain-containing protein n=1 Tax=Fibrella aquatilis TaxID=2817059 RepID=A0A939G5X2_9BACT|nr:nucleotidyltransferase domain-containing protein [Fibrella aquatilis]MBO0930797.1 nucleotidyltransferase domain-containing protein [Fibrella aquatilis]